MSTESAPPSTGGLQASALSAVLDEGPATTPPLVDHDAIAALWPGETILIFQQIITLFLHETDIRCSAVAEAGRILDRAALRHEGHTMKGAAANVGAARLESAAAALEITAPTAPPAALACAVTHFCEVARLTVAALAALGSGERS